MSPDMKVFMLAILVVGIALAHDKDSLTRDEKFPCNSMKAAALENGDDYVPQCNARGRFIKKQCDSQKCWCVTRRRGRRIFNDVEVPLNHYYDCIRKPNVCRVEELRLLMAGESKVPQCDCLGFYKEKQCEYVDASECNNGRRKRDTEELCGGTPSFLGFDVIDREFLDSLEPWTYVSKTGFLTKGTVTAFEVYVGGAGRPLRLGVYRPTGGDCTFTLIKQLEFGSLELGYQKVELTPEQMMMVEPGDRYGFTWPDASVLMHSKNTKDNYCEAPEIFNEGDLAELNMQHGDREYSIRFEVLECDDDSQSSCAGPQQLLGHEIIPRSKLDASIVWTMVDQTAFPEDGEVTFIEMYVGGANREIRVGQYRPTGDGNDMTLIQQKSWSGFEEGVVKIDLLGNDIMKVKAGDHVGFTWVNHGVVMYENSHGEFNYLTSSSSYNVGDVAMLGASGADRTYSFRVGYKLCDMTCKQCYCVDKNTGKEIEDTRTTDSLECGTSMP